MSVHLFCGQGLFQLLAVAVKSQWSVSKQTV